ncbi:hypothetical protein Micbo1qcDRAFT_161796 [Microdochium bolleyi]|uniref:Uncharacterized protein n=1 Tax=Microdochium bolleyi TaxID=196109 RepID=A0A136J3M2_9PEZI|nr:hypothetical protein Micbo1qcDRAFT_161796 [Microdochium bolleyi]
MRHTSKLDIDPFAKTASTKSKQQRSQYTTRTPPLPLQLSFRLLSPSPNTTRQRAPPLHGTSRDQTKNPQEPPTSRAAFWKEPFDNNHREKKHSTMSSDSTTPITPARFAAALKDLSAENLALKVFELRNSIAHLDYSNAELRPYAEGLVPVMGEGNDTTSTSTTAAGAATSQPQQQQGDQDCIDAIAENEVVIARMLERIDLIKAEVLERGLSWDELSGVLPERDDPAVGVVSQTMPASSSTPPSSSSAQQPSHTPSSSAAVNGTAPPTTNGTSTTGGGGGAEQQHEAWRDGTLTTGTIRTGGPGLSDEELLRRLQEQIPGLGGDEDDEGGMHL